MKTLACVLALLGIFLLTGCGGDYGGTEPKEEVVLGSFDGEFFLDTSVQGTVDKVVVSVYESCGDFLTGLLQCVVDFVMIELGDDVERRHAPHIRNARRN